MLEKIKKDLEKVARQMADEEIKNYPVHVVIDGELVDAEICDTTGGEIYIEIKTPLFFSETGREFEITPKIRKGVA